MHEQCFEALSHCVFETPCTLIQAFCSWYKIWKLPTAIHALWRFVEFCTPSLDIAIGVLDPDIPLLVLQQLHDQVRVEYNSLQDEEAAFRNASTFANLLLLLSSSDGISDPTITSFFGPRIHKLYDFLVAILDPSGKLDGCMTRIGYYIKFHFIGAMSVMMTNLHNKFNQSHRIGPLPPCLEQFPIKQNLPDTMYLSVFIAFSTMRALNHCGNLACHECSPLLTPFSRFSLVQNQETNRRVHSRSSTAARVARYCATVSST